ncbi:hypothetical protein AOCH_004853 [Aspergillus ochraceoroseus]|uniref:Ubiquitin carboxyl-terminal hydrolase n=1 Tax=Aspergillus ochraceoroseus TaxID=138278 RepID=A0A0F8UQ30_9EURO|nr:hypothetical protein AOCH_004853 [Aspergillus ochraceoroseus]
MADGGGWSTIESDEGVFTSLVETLGVQDIQFEELISLDADTIRSLGTVYGVIFLFKWIRDPAQDHPQQHDQQQQQQQQQQETPKDGTYDPSTPLFFAAQTIQNACATQAILSVILNQDTTTTNHQQHPPIRIGADLRAFKDFTAGFPPELRGEALSNSEAIRTAHNAFSRASPFVDETAPRAAAATDADEDVYHFIAYTAVDGVLFELDGLQPYPIRHGDCSGGEEGEGEGEGGGGRRDDFAEKVIEVLRRRIARYPDGETRFNLMAVVRDLRIRAREAGDVEGLLGEERKRRTWAWENSLRKSNFVGFIGEVLKGVAARKENEGRFEDWVERAEAETARKLQRR